MYSWRRGRCVHVAPLPNRACLGRKCDHTQVDILPMSLFWQVPVGRDFRVSAAAVARAVTRNTVLVVASSPCYPHGVIDDVAGIARVRAQRSSALI